MFFTSCEPEIVLPVLQSKSKQKQFYGHDLYKTRKSIKKCIQIMAEIEERRNYLVLN